MGSGVAPDLLVTDKSNRRLPPAVGECHYSIVVTNYRDEIESQRMRLRREPVLGPRIFIRGEYEGIRGLPPAAINCPLTTDN